MTSITISVDDGDIREALGRLAQRGENLRPVLQAIGDDMVERTKRRFETSTGPDGQAWAPNSTATLGLLADRLGKSFRKKDGSLNKSGSARLANKKPLIGESGDLRRQFAALASDSDVTVTSTPGYAAIHQFGGKAGRGHKVVIPARPFLPIRADGTLYPSEQAEVLDAINSYLLESR